MNVQWDRSNFTADENAPLVHYEIKKQCMYFHGFFITIIFSFGCYFLAHMSWIMATGLIINAAMGVSLYLTLF
jgi:hypothetical protein